MSKEQRQGPACPQHLPVTRRLAWLGCGVGGGEGSPGKGCWWREEHFGTQRCQVAERLWLWMFR